MEASIELCTHNQFSPIDLEKVIVRVKADSAKTLATRNITNHMASRFSLPYAVASAIVRKENSSMHDFEEPAIFDQDVLDLMNKIDIVADQELTNFHKQTGGFPAHVEMNAGKLNVTLRIDYPVGSSQRPMSWDDLEAKFVELTKDQYSCEQQQNIMNAGKTLEIMQDIGGLTRLL